MGYRVAPHVARTLVPLAAALRQRAQGETPFAEGDVGTQTG
jgi:hypothetical protein